MLITALAGIFVLGVVILIHEFGHFFVAKVSGIFVKTFSIGFGQKILRKRIGETDYAFSILPFGGYVKFAGEIDDGGPAAEPVEEEPSGDEIPDSEIPPERYFKNKNIPIKSAVILAGPLMNFVLAIVIYTFVSYAQGLPVTSTMTIGDIKAGSPADSCGLMVGDQILTVDGKEIMNWYEMIDTVLVDRDTPKTLQIVRGADTLLVDFKSKVENNLIQLGFRPLLPAVVGNVKRDAPAYRAGMRPGAVIEAINDTAIVSYYDIERTIHPRPKIPLAVRWSQDGVTHLDTLIPEAKKVLKEGTKTEMKTVGQIGVGPSYEKESIPFTTAIQMGFRASWRMTTDILSFLKLLVTGKAGLDSLGGPILITQMAGEMARWGFHYLLYFLAFFSINLCIFNLLPILPFDGGHLSLFLYEGITRRNVNRRVREILTQAGFILVILLMTFVVILDVSRCAGSSPSPF